MKKLLVSVVAAFGLLAATSASAVTMVEPGGGPYDITSDTLFTFSPDSVDATSGVSYTLDFFSSVDPQPALAVSFGGTVEGLIEDVSLVWTNAADDILRSASLADFTIIDVIDGVQAFSGSLSTLFTAPDLAQSLTISITTSAFNGGDGLADFNVNVQPVPLPAPFLMLLAAAGGLVLVARRRAA